LWQRRQPLASQLASFWVARSTSLGIVNIRNAAWIPRHGLIRPFRTVMARPVTVTSQHALGELSAYSTIRVINTPQGCAPVEHGKARSAALIDR
jgi:hypothetical protein